MRSMLLLLVPKRRYKRKFAADGFTLSDAIEIGFEYQEVIVEDDIFLEEEEISLLFNYLLGTPEDNFDTLSDAEPIPVFADVVDVASDVTLDEAIELIFNYLQANADNVDITEDVNLIKEDLMNFDDALPSYEEEIDLTYV